MMTKKKKPGVSPPLVLDELIKFDQDSTMLHSNVCVCACAFFLHFYGPYIPNTSICVNSTK